MAELTFMAPGWLLASATGWRPFVTPAPLWDVWWVLLFPLLAAVAIVYKSTKRRTAGRIFAEAGQLWIYIVLAMLLGAVGLMVLVRLVLG